MSDATRDPTPEEVAEKHAAVWAAHQRTAEFRKDLEALINKHSRENASNTPDFVLAEFVLGALAAFDAATRLRTSWYAPPASSVAAPAPTFGEEGR